MHPYEIDLSALPDGGASILDLPNGDTLCPLPARIVPYEHGTPYARVIAGSVGDLGVRAYGDAAARPSVVLNARRPSVQAHLCRWLGLCWRGHVVGPCTIHREEHTGSISGGPVGWGWCLMSGPERVAVWPPSFTLLANITDPAEAIAVLVRHYGVGTLIGGRPVAPSPAPTAASPTVTASAPPSRFVLLPDGSAVDPAAVLGWRDAGPDATDIHLSSGERLSVYVPSAVVASRLGVSRG